MDELKLRENTAVVDESLDSETSPLNEEEIWRRRVAYLSRNDSIDIVLYCIVLTIVDALSSDNTGDNIPNESFNGG